MYKQEKLGHIHDYNIDVDNREIYLHSYFGTDEEDAGVDYRSAIMLIKNIRYLNLINDEPIILHMNIPGGSWEDCFAMWDTIKLSKAKIGIIAYSKVQSASSILLQAAKIRVLMPNVTTLIHYGSLSFDNEHKAAISNMQWSARESEKMIDIFTEKCIHSPLAQQKNWRRINVKKHILSQLDSKSDWILNAEQSIEYGFADGIYGTQGFMNIEQIKRKLKR